MQPPRPAVPLDRVYYPGRAADVYRYTARQGSVEASLSQTFDDIRQLIEEGSVRISEHGYDELVADDISV